MTELSLCSVKLGLNTPTILNGFASCAHGQPRSRPYLCYIPSGLERHRSSHLAMMISLWQSFLVITPAYFSLRMLSADGLLWLPVCMSLSKFYCRKTKSMFFFSVLIYYLFSVIIILKICWHMLAQKQLDCFLIELRG